MRPVTIADLRKIAGGSAPLAASLVEPINRHCADVGITTPLRMSHFLAHMAHETGRFKQLEENLNYTAKRLMQVWPKRFPTLASAQPYANNPKALASKVYGGRLGNTGPNDPWKFRGSGPYQLTGRDNFAKFGQAAGVDLVSNPDAARDPDTGVEVAARYFMARMAKAADRDDIAATTKALNGGALGLAERREMLERAKACFVTRAGFAALPEPDEADDDDVPSIPDGPADDPVAVLPIDLPISDPAVDEPKTVITNEGYTDEHQVELVQTWLRNLGYTEVGTPNGKLGAFTKGAIAAYRASKGMPPGQYIDDELILKLATDKEPRELPATRTDATAADVRARVPAAKASFLNRIWSYVLGAVGAVVAFVKGIIENISDARSYLEPVQDFLSNIPAWAWALGAVGIAGALYVNARRSEVALERGFKDGSIR